VFAGGSQRYLFVDPLNTDSFDYAKAAHRLFTSVDETDGQHRALAMS